MSLPRRGTEISGRQKDFRTFLMQQIELELHLKTQSVPRSKHSVSVIKTSQLMLCREITAVCFEIHTKHINTLCGQRAEFLNDTAPGTYSYRWAFKGLRGDASSQEKAPLRLSSVSPQITALSWSTASFFTTRSETIPWRDTRYRIAVNTAKGGSVTASK